MKHSKKLAAIAAAAMLLAGLAGCSAPASGKSTTPIEIWYRPGSLPTAAVKGVQKEFPQAKIKLVQTPDVDTKLASALRANSGVPDIAVALLSQYTGAVSKFVNVDDYGFGKVKADYLPWKVKLGQLNGEQIGVPIDIGPFGFFYRVDTMKKAGLPTDPTAVGKLVSTLDGYESVAKKVKAATGQYMCDSAAGLATQLRLADGFYFATKSGKYDPGAAISRSSFVDAVKFGQEGLCLNADQYSQDWNAGVTQNKLAGWVGPSYVSAALESAGTSSSGQWRVATPPTGAASQFGSFVSVFKASKAPSLATKIAIWLTNPTNMAKGYAQNSLFPSTPASLTMKEMTEPEKFFGGQVTAKVLGSVAKDAPNLTIIPQSDPAATLFGQAIDQAVLNDTSPDAAYAAALAKAKTL